MLNRSLKFFLVSVVLATITAQAAAAHARNDTPAAEQIKQKVIRFGVGEKARVEVKLKNGTTLKGHISEAGDNSFTVKDARTGSPTVVGYGDVEKLKGRNLSTGAKIAIGVGIGAAVLFVTAIISLRSQGGVLGVW